MFENASSHYVLLLHFKFAFARRWLEDFFREPKWGSSSSLVGEYTQPKISKSWSFGSYFAEIFQEIFARWTFRRRQWWICWHWHSRFVGSEGWIFVAVEMWQISLDGHHLFVKLHKFFKDGPNVCHPLANLENFVYLLNFFIALMNWMICRWKWCFCKSSCQFWQQ